jgi:ABC-type antimicrobial peptide transport system permease subunit
MVAAFADTFDQYEIGVLLSLGESRMKVISQFFVEIFICMIFALGIAAASGNVVGSRIDSIMISVKITTPATATKITIFFAKLETLFNG